MQVPQAGAAAPYPSDGLEPAGPSKPVTTRDSPGLACGICGLVVGRRSDFDRYWQSRNTRRKATGSIQRRRKDDTPRAPAVDAPGAVEDRTAGAAPYPSDGLEPTGPSKPVTTRDSPGLACGICGLVVGRRSDFDRYWQSRNTRRKATGSIQRRGKDDAPRKTPVVTYTSDSDDAFGGSHRPSYSLPPRKTTTATYTSDSDDAFGGSHRPSYSLPPRKTTTATYTSDSDDAFGGSKRDNGPLPPRHNGTLSNSEATYQRLPSHQLEHRKTTTATYNSATADTFRGSKRDDGSLPSRKTSTATSTSASAHIVGCRPPFDPILTYDQPAKYQSPPPGYQSPRPELRAETSAEGIRSFYSLPHRHFPKSTSQPATYQSLPPKYRQTTTDTSTSASADASEGSHRRSHSPPRRHFSKSISKRAIYQGLPPKLGADASGGSKSADASGGSKRDDGSLPRRHYDTFVGKPATYQSVPPKLGADASGGGKRDDGSLPRRHYDTFVGKPATYQSLPNELRIQIWNWVAVDNEHPARLWKLRRSFEEPGMYVYPVGNCIDDINIYLERRRDPINMMLRMDAAAIHAVYRRYQPVPADFAWACSELGIPRCLRRLMCVRRHVECVDWNCPLALAAECGCKIIWVDPVNDVFVLPDSPWRSLLANNYHIPERKACWLHGPTQLRGLEVVQNVLVSSHVFMRRLPDGTFEPPLTLDAYLQMEDVTDYDRLEGKPGHDEIRARDRAAVLRLPNLRVVFLLASGMREFGDNPRTILRALLNRADHGPREWLQGMAFTDIMTDKPSKKEWPIRDRTWRGRTIEWDLDFKKARMGKQPNENFARCWEPFAARGVTHQFLFWDEAIMKKCERSGRPIQTGPYVSFE